MFSKLFSLALIAGLTLQVSAHAVINPALGVTGTARRADAKRPSTAAPCGKNVNVAQTLAASTAVTLNGDSFTTTVTNFNGGRDGSRQVTAQVDPTGTGNSFVAATVTQNGDAAPKGTGSQDITVQLPAGTTCTGGSGNTCLVAFKTAGNFGNCIAVTQGAAAAGGATANAAANTTATDATAATGSTATNGTTTTGNTTTTGTGKTATGKAAKGQGKNRNKAGNAAAAAAADTAADTAASGQTAATGQTATGKTKAKNGANAAAATGQTATGKAKNGANAANAAFARPREIDVRAVASRAARLYRELEELASRSIASEDVFPDTDEDDFEDDE